jgi:hypothetical protein
MFGEIETPISDKVQRVIKTAHSVRTIKQPFSIFFDIY